MNMLDSLKSALQTSNQPVALSQDWALPLGPAPAGS
jgi:hypothetical protein